MSNEVEQFAEVLIARRGVLPDSMAADDCRRDVAALLASPAMAERDARLQSIAWELGHIAGDNYANCIEDQPNPYAEGDS